MTSSNSTVSRSTVRWGILGTGNIARQFAKGLDELPGTQLAAVGSRTRASAEAFAKAFGISTYYPSYEALAASDVDAVYVATPHTLHRDNTIMLLKAGKAVLCEKPFAINHAEAAEMVATARKRGVFLMEAMWTRFLPHMVRLRELLAEEVIGELRMLQADFGFRVDVNPEGRLFNPELGGGALLDVGVYPVALAHALFGPPTDIKGFANLGATGVDEEAATLFRHSGGRLALLSAAIRLNTPQEATLIGERGHIRLHSGWWRPSGFTVYRSGADPETVEPPCPLNGYNYEALEVGRCLREGLSESGTMPLDESLAILKTLDALRDQWGLRYPVEA